MKKEEILKNTRVISFMGLQMSNVQGLLSKDKDCEIKRLRDAWNRDVESILIIFEVVKPLLRYELGDDEVYGKSDVCLVRIDDTDLPRRVKELCRKNSLLTVKDLLGFGRRRLADCSNIGKTSMREVDKFIVESGLEEEWNRKEWIR